MLVSPRMDHSPIFWKIGGHSFDVSAHGLIMGVLNVTPDSFSDCGEFYSPERALDHGLRMAAEGAQIIDIGGESTRPGAHAVSAEVEAKRVLPVLKMLRAQSPVAISVDTSKAVVARAALDAGASIINDVSGGRADADMLPLAADRGAALIIMHMQGTPETMQLAPTYNDVVAQVTDFFRQQYSRAIECGIDPLAIAFDPGIGFGKTLEHNLELLRNLPQLRVENRPLAVGVSRKSFLGTVTGSSEMSARTSATIALTAVLRDRGANILRVHDVPENVAALRAAEAIQLR